MGKFFLLHYHRDFFDFLSYMRFVASDQADPRNHVLCIIVFLDRFDRPSGYVLICHNQQNALVSIDCFFSLQMPFPAFTHNICDSDIEDSRQHQCQPGIPLPFLQKEQI